MKIGEVFDKNVDYYNWKASEEEPEIKISESFIISKDLSHKFYNYFQIF